MMQFKKLYFIILLFNFIVSHGGFAQTWNPIDTLNKEYCNKLENFYLKKSIKIVEEFKTIADKNVRNEVLEIYKESSQNFLNTIQKGYFIEENKYSILLDSLKIKINKANPETKDIKVLLEINENPNAYNTGEDFISIQLPLLSKIENPYQLAFIICHEMAHQILQHPLNNLKEYVETSYSENIEYQINKIKKQKYNKNQQTELLLKDLVYGNRKVRRSQEIQADSLGFILFSKAFPLFKNEAITSLNLLDFIDIEKDSLTENDYMSLFHSESQPFNKQWIESDELNEYHYNTTSRIWEIDSLKTHPDCKKRIETLQTYFSIPFSKYENENKEFKTFQIQVQKDIIFGLYYKKSYGKSLYETLLMLKQFPDDIYLKKMVYNNLLKIQASQKNYTLNRYVETINPIFSKSYNTFLSFIRNLRKSEFENIILIYK